MVLFGEVRSDPLWSIATRYRACYPILSSCDAWAVHSGIQQGGG
jgi:hypothetical protein